MQMEYDLNQEPIELKKRLEEVRLLESRRSARLADQDRDTDFARLADMGGDRRKASHSIEVPCTLTPSHNSRKRPTSFTHDCIGDECSEMNECHAALILMKLHNSPKSSTIGDKWLSSSPSSSSASWSSGSSSPPLSDDGHVIHMLGMPNDASARIRTTSVSTSDEGIVVDFTEDVPRKKKAHRSRFLCRWKGCNIVENTSEKIENHIRNVHLRKTKARRSDHEEEFYYTEEEDEDDDDEDDEVEQTASPTSPPTLSHRDMARPPHEDPEYQRQIVGNFKQGRQYQQQHIANIRSMNNMNTHNLNSQHQQVQSNNALCTPTSPLANQNYTWPLGALPVSSTPISHQQQTHNQVTYIKHARSSPRPSQSTAPYPSPTYVHQQHHNYSSSPNSNSSSSNHSSPILHGSNSANNVLQQLSQQNVTITTHHNTVNNQQPQHHPHHVQQLQQQHQNHHQLSTVTITPNYHATQHQQTLRGFQAANGATASNIVATQSAQTNLQQQTHHTVVQHVAATAKQTPNSPNRRTRGENKKCRKVYGMERRDQWCTQCKWKKACTRFGD